MTDAVTDTMADAMTDEELRAAQVALNLAAHLLYDEPTDEDVAAYLEPGLFENTPFGEDDETVRAGLTLLDAWCRETAAAVAADPAALHSRAADLRSDWLNLLVGAGAPKAPSWAGYYLNPSSAILGESALAVRALYKRHGFQVQRLNQEPDDHLGLMLAFAAQLIQQQLVARGEGAAAAVESTVACQRELFQHSVLPWLAAWRWSVAQFARTDFYRGVGELVFGLGRAWAARLGFQYVDDAENPRFVLAS